MRNNKSSESKNMVMSYLASSLVRVLKVALVAGMLWGGLAEAAVTGNIAGRVTDQATGKPLAGVTVTISGPSLQGEQTEFTDRAGHYLITELPPGEYMVRFYFSNVKVERPGVVLNADKTLQVNAAVPTQQAKTQTYRITEKAPSIDVAGTQIETRVTNELVQNTPVRGVGGQRTYESVLTLAPGSTTDDVGYSFNGATGPENNYLIDGMNTTNPAYGLIGTRLTLEFIKETEIITGGYNAEYGRATGGVANIITKSGSNQFHGGAWFYYTPFQVDPTMRSRIGEALASKYKITRAFDFGFDVGGPILKDKIWFYAGFAPTYTTFQTERFLRSRLADNLPGDQISGSYGGDMMANQGCPSWLAKELCPPNTGYATKMLDSSYNQAIPNTQEWLYNWIAKLNFQINPNNSLVLQYIGSPSTFNGVQPFDGVHQGASLNGAISQMLTQRTSQVHDVSGHFISKLFNRKLQIDLLAGFHYESQSTTPVAAQGSQAAVIDLREAPLTRYEDISPCQPQMIHGVNFNPCPVMGYSAGGVGFLSDTTNYRITALAAATYFGRLGGTHAVKFGIDFEDNYYRDFRYYTGGDTGGLYYAMDGDWVMRQQFATVGADGTPQIASQGFEAKTNTFNEALYLRDSWNVGYVPGLTINVGLRWEMQQLMDTNGNVAINILDNLAPRVGFVYDWTGKGYSKLYASYGRYYESLPMDINDRMFSGEGLAYQPTDNCHMDTAGRMDVSSCQFSALQRNQVNGGTMSKVSPVLQGQYSNEVVAGLQYDVGWDTVLGAAYVHRDLGRIIEDISPDGGQNYIIANPGESTDQGVVNSMRNDISALDKRIANTTDPTKREELLTQKADKEQTLSLYQGVAKFPKPQRDYNALVLTVNKRFSHHFQVIASYTYSRTLGNYPGLYQSTTGQLDPNISTQYDLKELLVNHNGPLPTDRPHNFKIIGSYNVPLGPNNELTFGLNFNVLSGRPIEVLGAHPMYGVNEVFILPRGSGGRTPTLTAFDLHIGYGRRIGKSLRIDVIWDTFNLFNQQEVTEVDDSYTYDSVAPIVNGKLADLGHLRTTNGTPVNVNPNYGRATQFQQPLSMRFGLRVSF